MLIGTTDRSHSQEAKKPPISMIAFDKYRTALSQSQQLYHANDHGCKHEKTARTQVQQAPKKGWIPAGMRSRSSANGQQGVSNGTSLPPVQHPRGSRLQSLGASLKEPGGHHSISCGYSRNGYCQQLPRSLGWGTEAAFLSPVET